MMNYAHYELNDFLLDDQFVAWVKTGHPTTFWDDLVRQYPEKQPTAEQAKALIQAAATLPAIRPDARQIQQMWAQIEPVVQAQTPIRRLPVWSYRAAAASIALVLAVGGLWYRQQPPPAVTYRQLVAQSAVPLQEVDNQTTRPRRIYLADGSTVSLEPGSKLSFPKTFHRAIHRDVYLVGNAFFEVAKNPKQPFLVYSGELVTKVLGTSFRIRAGETDRQITVDVKTGRVSVFAQTDPQRAYQTDSPTLTGVVLTPNQQLTFDRDNRQLARSLVPQPELLPTTATTPSFDYDDTPAPVIFAALELAYGVDIVYDEDRLKNCRLTASLSSEPLFDKLQLLCQGLDATYEVIDARIIISAKGCSN